MNKHEGKEFPKLVCSEYGDPNKVIELESASIPEPDSYEVLVQMLMAPVNPVDINIIQGAYGIFKLPRPFVPGMEGVGKIVKIGSKVKKFEVGNHVIPKKFLGVWRTYLTAQEDDLIKVPNSLGLPEAASLFINPPTVYRMLKDFRDLMPGDTVIQNGANSACGLLAIQMCKILGVVSVNVVRNRPDIDNLKAYMRKLGATYVYTEDEIGNIDIFKTGKVSRPLLALNCVGGKSATSILRHLDIGGVMVTYGGMSMQPITVSTSTLVFREISLEGFNILNFMSNEDNLEENVKMFDEIINWYQSKQLIIPPYVLIKLDNFKECLENTVNKTGMVGKKYILDFTEIFSKM